MSRNDTIYTLQQDIEIPKIVTDKANKILEQIRKDADMKKWLHTRNRKENAERDIW